MTLRHRIFGICGRAVVVAALVGTALNLVNQGDALIAGEKIDVLKLTLTFLVPFAVSTHGALSALR
jgi:hypothetical protein